MLEPHVAAELGEHQRALEVGLLEEEALRQPRAASGVLLGRNEEFAGGETGEQRQGKRLSRKNERGIGRQFSIIPPYHETLKFNFSGT